MTKIRLESVHYKDIWHKKLAIYLYKHIKAMVFDPLIETSNEINKNAKDDALIKALKEGLIMYVDGKFVGKFSSRINIQMRIIGAVLKKGEWHIHKDFLPFVVKATIARNISNSAIFNKAIESRLEKILLNMPILLADLKKDDKELMAIADETLTKLNFKMKTTLRKSIAVQPKLDPEGLQKISKDYLTTIELPIRRTLERDSITGIRKSFDNFAQDTVEKLRADLNTMILEGAPRTHIQQYIQAKLNISKQRSIFIARQETALLTVMFKRSQYQQWGINEYKWSSAKDHIVRKRHMELDGQTFDWDHPPIVSEANQPERRGHPGMDWNCRCVDIPIADV